MEINFILNDMDVHVQKPSGMPLLDIIRDEFQLKGTKAGCREGDCGSCMVLIGKMKDGVVSYRTANSCLFPLGQAEGTHVVTIEGLKQDYLTLIQNRFQEEKASQCGFCTPGFIVSLTGYFLQTETPDEQSAIEFLSGNICRCTGYGSIKRAVKSIFDRLNENDFSSFGHENLAGQLAEARIIPPYFLGIPERLKLLPTEKITDANPAHGRVIVAGGTDLYVRNCDELSDEEPVFINKDTHNKIFLSDGFCLIPAGLAVTDFFASPIIQQRVRGIEKFEHLISCPSIRNRATIGGNIINASPIGDMSIILLALDAEVVLNSASGERRVALKNFFLSYKKLDIRENELLLYIAVPDKIRHFHFEKISKRTHLDIASVNMAMACDIGNEQLNPISISAGGVAPVPFYLQKTSEILGNTDISEITTADLLETAIGEISPISDIRGSAEYKKLLFRQLLSVNIHKLEEYETIRH